MLKNSKYVYLILTFENQCFRSIIDNLPRKIVQLVGHNVNTIKDIYFVKFLTFSEIVVEINGGGNWTLITVI